MLGDQTRYILTRPMTGQASHLHQFRHPGGDRVQDHLVSQDGSIIINCPFLPPGPWRDNVDVLTSSNRTDRNTKHPPTSTAGRCRTLAIFTSLACFVPVQTPRARHVSEHFLSLSAHIVLQLGAEVKAGGDLLGANLSESSTQRLETQILDKVTFIAYN